jgi:hypothetical protein
MAINIPSNVPIPPIQDFHQQDLIRPTEAPTVVEGVRSVDPRIALNLTMPVTPTGDGSNLSDALSAGLQNNAVILEIANNQSPYIGDGSKNIAESIAKLDSLGSLALGQLLSELFVGDQVSFTDLQNGNTNNLKGAVAWPNSQNIQTQAQATNDPRVTMSLLYKNLENSGIFAASQLKSLLIPASKLDEDQHAFHQSLVKDANALLSQLTGDSAALKDSVRLLLKGELVWQGQLLPNVQANIYRQDAWEKDPQNPNEVIKGTSFTITMNLPMLGPLEVRGTQFGEQVKISVKATSEGKDLLQAKFDSLLSQMSKTNSENVNVSFAQDSQG